MKLIKNYKEGKVTTADIRTIDNAVIWLMVIIAITSIVWGISLHIASADFNNGIVGAKLIFRARDFQQMDKRTKDVFYQDLGELLNRTYTDAALEGRLIKTTDNHDAKSNQNEAVLKTTEDINLSEPTTIKPKKRRILHLFRISPSTDQQKNNNHDEDDENDDDELNEANTTALPMRYVDVVADRKFLASMAADLKHPFWKQSIAVQYVYSFPFLTEIMAIIWTAMCLVFQSGVKKYWGLPKPWRIVVPSIFVFALMTLATMIYIIIANRFLKTFCTCLKEPLSDPSIISCGEAMSVLRPIIKRHQFSPEVYLNLFRVSYILSFLLWATALVIMVLRYVFAIDFQLVDVHSGYESPVQRRRSSESNAEKQKLQAPQNAPKILRVDERSKHKSEEDFQSATSIISEVATPLLENNAATQSKIA